LRGRKVPPTLAAHRSFSRHIIHLLEATVWTFHTELSRRRLCHS
jgi:hypothetical protein